MEIFKVLNGFDGHAVHFVYDRASHLRAIIAIDTVVDGRAVGGVRLSDYPDEESALLDACNLARTMSFKAILSGLPCGGAKTVIYRHPQMKRAPAFRALGDAIEELKGLYHAGSDMGTTTTDLLQMAERTTHVSHALDFGKHTAIGVAHAIRAAVKHQLGQDSVAELRIAIQGLGDVGMELARVLSAEGAHLVVTDMVKARALKARREFDAEVVHPDDILTEPCDVLAPCALGGVITADNVPLLGASIICGSANNMLTDAGVAMLLRDEGKLWIPDFIASAGALIVGVTEIAHGAKRARGALVERIFDTTLEILEIADRRRLNPLQAAETRAAQLLKERE